MNRVLIIEDDAVARRQLAQMFRFENFAVSEADSGKAGIAAAIEETPDLVVCDIMMPGTDGFGVLEALRKCQATALTPFIFLTAKAAGADVRHGMGQGADDYITKPFDPEALLASAQQRLARRRLQKQEAERRGTDTGMRAAAILPCAMEGCLAQIEAISEAMAARYQDAEMLFAIKREVVRLRTLSLRLRLYGELPRLYARRFGPLERGAESCPAQIAVDAAQEVAADWNRVADLEVSVESAHLPLPAGALQIMTRELVDNACKFSAASTPIVVRIQSERAFSNIVVADHGSGIRPHQVCDIGAFQQFWSGPERPDGLGLGLVLVQALTRLHSGEVSIESEPGSGTRVSIMVPTE